MIKATNLDKGRVAEILTRSFDRNQSVNYVIPHDKKREKRIKALMNYSFDVCHAFGEVYLSDDRRACLFGPGSWLQVVFSEKRVSS